MAEERIILITGCSSGGIGHALAREFHSKGLRVFATARRLDSMVELQEMGITTLELDVTDLVNVRRVCDQIAQATDGKLDFLVNNAGQTYPIPVMDVDMDRVRAVFEVNFFAAIVMVQEFIPLLMASNGGCIIQMGSMSGIMPVPFGIAYNASKAALHSLSDTLRVELAPFNIRVINVVTGQVKSNIVKPCTLSSNSLYIPMNDLYQQRRINVSQQNATSTDDYAHILVSEVLKQSPKGWLWVGKNSWFCWFVNRFLPRGTFDIMMSKMFGLNEFARRLETVKDAIAEW